MFSREDEAWGISRAFIYTFVVAVCAILFATIIVASKPAWLGFEHQSFKASHQYQEATESQIRTLMDEYTGPTATEAHKVVLLGRIHNEAASLAETPDDIQSFLDSNPKR